jgi:glycosyltransferase XagB
MATAQREDSASAPSPDNAHMLAELGRMRAFGQITQHEFETRRAAVLMEPVNGLEPRHPESAAVPPKEVAGRPPSQLEPAAAPARPENAQILAELGQRRAFGQITQFEFETRRTTALAKAADAPSLRHPEPAAAPAKALDVLPPRYRDLRAALNEALDGLRVSHPEPRSGLAEAVDGLRLRHPDLSASRVLTRSQALVLIGLAVVCALGLFLAPLTTGVVLAACITAVYALVFVNNIAIFRRLTRTPNLVEVTDTEARAIPDHALPIYTVLVAAYREPEVIAATLRALSQLEYPADRLDIKLLLEADDEATRAAVRAAHPAPNVHVVLVPPGQPRTKPKALNFGLMHARGELITIYDAEDRPEPLQLRRAVVAFSRVEARVACLQAKLEYHNSSQNLLTSWFAIEYLSWFGFALPAIAHGSTPVPLGGTSMHMRRSVLEQIGAWDPFNVTEDCDLGVRLYRMGYRTAFLNSTTYEEANSDVINWVKQRSRWYKGYAQTWLVHMRHPRCLLRELGLRGFCGFNLLVGATTLTALLNPIFWALTVTWFVAHPAFIEHIFPSWIYFPGMLSMIVGNFLGYYAGLITIRASNRPDLTKAALLIPACWALMSVGALRAFLQLLVSPFVWEKTAHGLDRQLLPEPEG